MPARHFHLPGPRRQNAPARPPPMPNNPPRATRQPLIAENSPEYAMPLTQAGTAPGQTPAMGHSRGYLASANPSYGTQPGSEHQPCAIAGVRYLAANPSYGPSPG